MPKAAKSSSKTVNKKTHIVAPVSSKLTTAIGKKMVIALGKKADNASATSKPARGRKAVNRNVARPPAIATPSQQLSSDFFKEVEVPPPRVGGSTIHPHGRGVARQLETTTVVDIECTLHRQRPRKPDVVVLLITSSPMRVIIARPSKSSQARQAEVLPTNIVPLTSEAGTAPSQLVTEEGKSKQLHKSEGGPLV